MITFENVGKRYGEHIVLEDINVEIHQGEIMVLLGASGCGKTTCLKMINRLENPSQGRILMKGEDIQEKDVIKYRRNIGYVLQNTGLFPHMTVGENLSLLQNIEKIPKEQIEETNRNLMAMIGLDYETYMNRYPHQLSGGQKQRVGVARAFALNPEVVLMDEPFSAVDPLVRLSLQDELLEIQKKMKKTIVFVTHDIGEAFRIGNRICLFHDQTIVQCGTPDDFINHPANEYVKTFIGNAGLDTGFKQNSITRSINREFVVANPEERVGDIETKLNYNKDKKVIVIDKDNYLVGMASYSRITGTVDKSTTVKDVMWTYFRTVKENESINDIIFAMNEYGVSYLPVEDGNNKVIGTIAAIDILEMMS